MKREKPDLFAVLLISLMTNLLLGDGTGYWARLGLLSFPACAAALAGVAWLFARSWRQVEPLRPVRWLWLALLTGAAALELLRLWQLLCGVYPGSLTLLGVCLAALLPVLYLRRVSAIAQTANVLLTLSLPAGLILIASVTGGLRVSNLQTPACTAAAWGQAAAAQMVVYPELLMPALWPDHDKRGPHTAARLAGIGLAVSAGLQLVLELYFGAALPWQENPVHTAARAGTFLLFRRLEWLQLALWCMMVSVKLALYLYAGVRLLGGQGCKSENNAVGIKRLPVYFLLVVSLCFCWRQTDPERLFAAQNRLTAAFAAAVIAGGGFLWLCRSQKNC